MAILSLKILGYPEPGVTLKQFFLHYKRIIIGIVLFLHFIPINFYAIKRLHDENFGSFQVKILSKEP
jgi:hypothetical protein